jgi:hypothetical protein
MPWTLSPPEKKIKDPVKLTGMYVFSLFDILPV